MKPQYSAAASLVYNRLVSLTSSLLECAYCIKSCSAIAIYSCRTNRGRQRPYMPLSLQLNRVPLYGDCCWLAANALARQPLLHRHGRSEQREKLKSVTNWMTIFDTRPMAGVLSSTIGAAL